MSDGVEPGLEEDDDSGELVQVDVVVQRQLGGQAHLPHEGDGVTKNEEQDHHRVEVQAHS